MKSILTAGVLAVSLAGSAYAQNMFATMTRSQDENSTTIVIENLTATGDGFIAIYDYHTDEVGDLLGVASVAAGGNTETRVQLGRPVQRDVIALLFIGGDFSDPSAAVDSVEIEIDD